MKTLDELTMGIAEGLDQASDRVRLALREKAIEKAKARIALAGRRISEIEKSDLELIVKDEEDKIKETYKGLAGIGLLAFLGLN